MLRVQSYGSGEIFHPSLLRLVGQTINEVQRQILNLGFRAASTACWTCSMVWTRPMVRSSSSQADCIPKEIRLKPQRRKARRAFQSPAESGLASSDLRVTGHLITLFNDL